MTYKMTNKTALVTGGSRGIGAAIVRRLAEEGAHVAFTYSQSGDAADALVAQIKFDGGVAHAIQADAADTAQTEAAVKTAAETLGGLDILVHNAGTFGPAPIQEAGFEEYRRQFAVNVDGVYVGTHAAIPHIRDGGRILVVSSVNAYRMPFPGFGPYSGSKAAVTAMVKAWARDLGPRGILVNAIQPGPIDTDLNPVDGPFGPMATPLTALGRYGHADEVAALAAFLASDEASYITGAALDVDGGMAI